MGKIQNLICFLNISMTTKNFINWTEATIASESIAMNLSIKAQLATEVVLPDYVAPYTQVFSEKALMQMPISHPYDMTIKLKEGLQPKMAKVFPITGSEGEEI